MVQEKVKKMQFLTDLYHTIFLIFLVTDAQKQIFGHQKENFNILDFPMISKLSRESD